MNIYEEWRDIPGYKDLYQISNLGNVKRIDTGHILALRSHKGSKTKGDNRYKTVSLWKDGIGKDYLVHRLVAQSFIPNPNNKPQVNHIDGNKSNNRVDNLEWVSREENARHAFKVGLYKHRSQLMSRRVSMFSLEGTFIKTFPSIESASKAINASPSNIIQVCKGNRKQTKGFKFKYAEERRTI